MYTMYLQFDFVYRYLCDNNINKNRTKLFLNLVGNSKNIIKSWVHKKSLMDWVAISFKEQLKTIQKNINFSWQPDDILIRRGSPSLEELHQTGGSVSSKIIQNKIKRHSAILSFLPLPVSQNSWSSMKIRKKASIARNIMTFPWLWQFFT